MGLNGIVHIAFGVAIGVMTHVSDPATAILWALSEAYSAGKTPRAIILDQATQKSLQRAGFGCWSARAASPMLFNVPVVIGLVQGWSLRVV